MQEQDFVLTFDKIKATIAFEKGSTLYLSLIGLVDCWYAIAKQEGKSEGEALKITLDKLGKKMLSFATEQ